MTNREQKQREPSDARSVALSRQEALLRVSRALDQIAYGEIIVKVENGKPVWVDKYERERVG